jgi:hypothetical protein
MKRGDGHDTRSIQDYLGNKNIQHTVRYTELSPTRVKDFWPTKYETEAAASSLFGAQFCDAEEARMR